MVSDPNPASATGPRCSISTAGGFVQPIVQVCTWPLVAEMIGPLWGERHVAALRRGA